MVYKNCLRHRNGLTSRNNLLSCVVGLNLVHCRGVGGERIAVWMSVKLAVWQAERVKQYGLLSLPASKSAHTERDPWTPLFTLLAAALTLWHSDSLIYNLYSHFIFLTLRLIMSSAMEKVWIHRSPLMKMGHGNSFTLFLPRMMHQKWSEAETTFLPKWLSTNGALPTSTFNVEIWSFSASWLLSLPPVLLTSMQHRAGLCALAWLFVLALRHL